MSLYAIIMMIMMMMIIMFQRGLAIDMILFACCNFFFKVTTFEPIWRRGLQQRFWNTFYKTSRWLIEVRDVLSSHPAQIIFKGGGSQHMGCVCSSCDKSFSKWPRWLSDWLVDWLVDRLVN